MERKDDQQRQVGKNMEGGSHVVFKNSSPAFALREWETSISNLSRERSRTTLEQDVSRLEM
jgi:hypothetical protein